MGFEKWQGVAGRTGSSIDIREEMGKFSTDIREDTVTKADSNEQVLQGTLDLLILKTLSLSPMHGWGLTHRIQDLSRDAFRVGQGSIYPALVRLEQRGLVLTEWKITENGRRAKFYRISTPGRRAMGEELASWKRFVGAMDLVLDATV